MKGYPLTNEVSVQEMLRMRTEYGMSNTEIASALDCSQRTVWGYIGKGPRSKNQNRGGTAVPAEIKKKDPVEACLKVEPSAINLIGAYGHYTIDEKQEAIFILAERDGHELSGYMPIDQLSTLIKELQAIERNLDKAKPQLEVW